MFFTTGTGSAEEHANLNFGTAHGNPSAQDIWDLRQTGLASAFDIDLVWVADSPPPEAAADATEAASGEEVDGVDAGLNLVHEPKNDGQPEHNQTGGDDKSYQTRLITHPETGVVRKFTLDRSTAKRGKVQPHKTWVVDKDHTWTQWPKAATMNWNHKKVIADLNKWRNQRCGRHGWPALREKDSRPEYTPQQMEWIYEKCAGSMPKDLAAFVRRFNARWNDNRTNKALENLTWRMKDRWKGSGKFTPGPGRGVKRKSDNDGSGGGGSTAKKTKFVLRVRPPPKKQDETEKGEEEEAAEDDASEKAASDDSYKPDGDDESMDFD